MRIIFRSFLILLLVVCYTMKLSAQAKKAVLAPVPKWVKEIALPFSIAVDEKKVDGGYYYLTLDEQENIQSEEVFCHYALKVLSDVGTQDASQFSVNYDPAFQEVTFHGIRIIRDGKSINKYDPKSIKFIQQESQLDSKIYDGSFTAYIFLSDVRKGDVIEYSYTLKGRNPVFNQLFFGTQGIAYSDPCPLIYYRLLCPKERKPNYKVVGAANLEPTVSEFSNGQVEYEWKTSCLNPVLSEDDVPDGYVAYPFLDITEFKSWSEVVNWALPYYDLTIPINQELKDKVAELTGKKLKREDKILSLIRFVQDEVRYMGFEIGVNSHKPNAPDKVFMNRFGDCKDKAYLLCCMLKEIGVTAYPNLINTYKKENILERLPSPGHFNHVTVCIELDGKTYWIDPTYSHQRGNLEHTQYPQYEYTLVLKEGQQTLTRINLPNIKRQVITRENFKVLDTLQAMKLQVVTEYYGKDADDARYDFATQSRVEIEKRYTNFYNSLYGNVESTRSIDIYDDEENNIFKTLEEYDLPNAWNRDGRTRLELSPQAMYANLTLPNNRNRKMPLALTYPYNYEQIITIEMPFESGIGEEAYHLANDFFKYDFIAEKGATDKIIVLNYSYSTKRAEVAPGNMVKFVQDMETARQYRYNVYADGGKGASAANLNWLLIIIAIGVAITSVFLGIRFYKQDITPVHEAEYGLKIGGWLILVMISCFFSPIVTAYNFLKADYFNLATWNAISTSDSPIYHPLWPVFYLFEMIWFVGYIAFGVLVFILFIKRRSSLPKAYIYYMLVLLVFNIFETIMYSVLPTNDKAAFKTIVTGLLRAILLSGIWIPYFLKSERVKQTFVFTYDKDKELKYLVESEAPKDIE